MGEIVLYVAGGAMSGIFSAGVLRALSEAGLRDHVSAVYGISAGAFNVAHFATATTHRLTEWYLQHVPSRRIIRSGNPLGVLRGEELLDLQGAEHTLRSEQLLSVKSLMASPFPVFFGVVDAQSMEFHFLDARRDDALQVLIASATAYPFARAPTALDGRLYIDGGYQEYICLERLRARHPGAKFIIITNNAENSFSMRSFLMRLMVRYIDAQLARIWLASLARGRTELLDARSASDVVLVQPDADFPVDLVTMDVPTLKKGYAMGYQMGLREADRILSLCTESPVAR